jgi:heme iron utilization protein
MSRKTERKSGNTVIQDEQIPVAANKGNVFVPERLKALDKEEHFGVLATSDNGKPYTSLVAYALSPDSKKIIFTTSKKTSKYRNILHSAHVALLIDNRIQSQQKLLETEVITVIGTAKPIRRGKTWKELAMVFLAKHPEFDSFLISPVTALIAIEITRCIHVSSFQTLSICDY